MAPASRILTACLLAVLTAAAHAGTPASTGPSVALRATPILPKGPHPDRQVEMLSRKIGQMLMTGFVGTDPRDPEVAAARDRIEAGALGGVILFADNVRSPDQLRALTGPLAAAGDGLPPFIAVDQEGGGIQRLTARKGFAPLASARRMARKPVCEARDLYLRAAEQLAAFGINVNFGPVVDLDINPANPAIGRLARSYGRDAGTVIAYGEAFMTAHAAAGVLTAAKHFPGHGSAAFDPHVAAIVDIETVWRPEELAPFAALVADGVPMVMVGHLLHPRFSDGDRPASLSRRTIAKELRGRLGFAGIVVTDDLGMDAVAARYPAEEIAEMAIAAGADLLIFSRAESKAPGSIDRIVAAVAGAVAAGRLAEADIDAATVRLRAARLALGRGGPLAELPPCREATPAALPAPLTEPAPG